MPRIRFIKPEFFTDPDVIELSPMARLLFIGLWTQADREGRLEYDPRRLKIVLFPGDEVDITRLAGELHDKDMVRTYLSTAGREIMWLTKFTTHQKPHPKEAQSVIEPCPDQAVEKHGKPCNYTASKPDSGFLILDSGVRIPAEAESAPPKPTPSKPQTIIQPRRKDAAWEGPKLYVPQRSHRDFVAWRNGDEKTLLAWYESISNDWTTGAHKDAEVGGDMFAFWRERYAEKWPRHAPAKPERSSGPVVLDAAATRAKYLQP